MSRNSAGTYSLPFPDVQTGTPISSTWANGTMDDLGNEITNSLSRTGFGGMLAPLRGIQGSAPLPAYAFTADNSSGMYLAAASDLRFVTNSSDRLRLTNTAAYVFTPTTITTTQSNTAGVTSTGNGTGAGIVSTGGATGPGGTFTGNGGGHGLTATGQGAGHGVVATAGASGIGVVATGGITSTGATLDASGTAMPTKYAFASSDMASTTGNNYPLVSIGKTKAGNTVALNTRARAINTVSSWTDVEMGLSYDVDSTTGAGGQIWLGPRGVRLMGNQTATATTPSNGAVLTNGYLGFDTAVVAPNSNVAVKNAVTPTNIVKAWGVFTLNGSGGVNVTSGFNIASASVSGANLVITFAQAFADTNYCVSAVIDTAAHLRPLTQTTTQLTVKAFQYSAPTTPGSYVDFPLTSGVWRLHVQCIGAQ